MVILLLLVCKYFDYIKIYAPNAHFCERDMFICCHEKLFAWTYPANAVRPIVVKRNLFPGSHISFLVLPLLCLRRCAAMPMFIGFFSLLSFFFESICTHDALLLGLLSEQGLPFAASVLPILLIASSDRVPLPRPNEHAQARNKSTYLSIYFP